MFQFLATHRLCPRNSGRDITDLAVAMGCTHAGFEEAVWPRIKSSLRRKLAELHRDGNIVIYNDDDGVERAYWPAEAELWRRDNWDGRRDCRVPPLIREQLEAYGTLSDMGRDPRRRAGANVFERTSGRRHSQSTVVPSRVASPAGGRESTGGTRDSELAEPGVPAPSALSDDGSRRLSVLSRSDGLPASALSDDDSSPPSALSSDTASVALAMSAMDIDPPPAAVDSNRVLSDSQVSHPLTQQETPANRDHSFASYFVFFAGRGPRGGGGRHGL